MAVGPTTFQALGGAVDDLFSASAFRTRAEGDRLQAQEYDLAGGLARQNKQFAETSAAIKDMQIQRGIYGVLGQQAADVGASGFESGGSALDLLRDSAQQGALTKAVASQQGLIEEAGYEEQAKSYDLQAQTARMAADADEKAAHGKTFSAVIKGITSIATLGFGGLPGGLPGGGER